jgi:hypothetical protein
MATPAVTVIIFIPQKPRLNHHVKGIIPQVMDREAVKYVGAEDICHNINLTKSRGGFPDYSTKEKILIHGYVLYLKNVDKRKKI